MSCIVVLRAGITINNKRNYENSLIERCCKVAKLYKSNTCKSVIKNITAELKKKIIQKPTHAQQDKN